MIKTDSSSFQSMQRDSAVLLYNNGISGIAISIIASTFLVFAFSAEAAYSFKKIWWASMMMILLIRFTDVMVFKRATENTEFNGTKSIRRFTWGANLTAIMWSTYLMYIAIHFSEIELTTTIIAVCGMAGGSATVLAAHRFTAMFYPFMLLAPSSIFILFSDIYAQRLLGILGFSFSIVMLVIAKNSAKFTQHTIFLKHQNTDLLHSMEEKVEQRTQKIYELSNLDPLTQLYNRTAFLKQLHLLINTTNQPFALLFIDLDGFKKINDSAGHKTGDKILKATADRIKTYCLNEQLVCRWGGDEFLIAFNDTTKNEAIEKSKQLILRVSEQHDSDNGLLSVGATVGIALYPEHCTSADKLIQLADMAMYYQKKHSSRSVGVFTEQMEKLFHRELHLKNSLAKAIQKNQLRLVFQPILHAKTLKVAAFESLIRWRLNDENISPDEFIGIAEQYGLIHEIGSWVLINACKQACLWNNNKQIAVCVNVSVIQLQEDNFIAIVESALTTTGLSAELLHIEITESVFAADTAVISSRIKSLQALGIKVSIDDFGTGYSSLSIMQDLAVNIVKIDRTFVNNIASNGDAIVSAVMHIASSLDFLVVAEGVETNEQAQALLYLGVNYFQGFYYSKPLEIEKIDTYLLNNNKVTHGKTTTFINNA